MNSENINSPADIKKLEISQLRTLADETRAALINKLSKAGGHQGPNLGVVELTVAFHYVFDSPKDKIVFDVSHQCYPHKILKGIKEALCRTGVMRNANRLWAQKYVIVLVLTE